MNDLISRDALFALLNADIDGHVSDDDIAATVNWVLESISTAPAIVPQVVINVTGGVADVVAGTHKVEVNVLDYDINDNEQSDYIVDEDGDQAWLYGEVCNVDPAQVEKILNYPEVGETEDDDA